MIMKKINNNCFSQLNKPYLIAEIGVNHNGDMALAKALIDKAKDIGLDAVKFQSFKTELLARKSTPKVPYQNSSGSAAETHFEMLKKLELTEIQHEELFEYCLDKEIDFISTPYDIFSAKFLVDLGVKFFKTASADLVDLQLQKFIASTGIPTIIATGMASMSEIEEVLQIYEDENNPHTVFLHCVSNYPCSDASLNLFAMKKMGLILDKPIGYSDHSKGFMAAALSIALGAVVLEKHFTLDHSLDGPDHLASSTPDELRSWVEAINTAHVMLGSSKKQRQPEEFDMANVSRKSICASRDMAVGEILTLDDVIFLRPGTGLAPKLVDQIIGLSLNEDVVQNDQLSLHHFARKK